MIKRRLSPGLLILLSCLTATAQLQNGQWRAALLRPDGNEIVFNFLVKDSAGRQILYIENASERLLVDDIRKVGDSVFITLPFFEAQLHVAWASANELRGVYLKHLQDRYQVMAARAFYRQDFRFPVLHQKVTANVTGRWAVKFWSDSSRDTTLDVGEFLQQGYRVTGTFLDPTGDYRFLEGVVDGDMLRLSCFDGSHAYGFTAVVKDNTMEGRHFSGPVFQNHWVARRDETAHLPDEFTLTKLKPGASRLDFSFRDIQGKKVSLSDGRYKNKVVIVQLMGSWCPNCMDETVLLSKLYDAYHNKGLEVIGLAYERSTDFARSQKSLVAFQRRFAVHYELLISGVSVYDSMKTEKTLPQLQEIVGYPTTIFIGRDGEVAKIHTGFNGPGTGEHYAEQRKKFYAIVDDLLGK